MKNLLALFMLTISLTFGLSQATFATVQDEFDTTTVVEETALLKKKWWKQLQKHQVLR